MVKMVNRGFTLIEVALFLAVTGMLFVGIVAGVQGSLFNQRYNDSVQSFAEFLRSMYSQTANVENSQLTGGGRSEQAIYGKLVTFGERLDFEGKEVTDDRVFIYTVIGAAEGDIGTGDVKESLLQANANVFIKNVDKKLDYAGIVEQYFPRWTAEIQTDEEPFKEYRGALLIVRHPSSGTVFTYSYNDNGKTVEVNEMRKDNENRVWGDNEPLPTPLNEDILKNFSIGDVDFCINPEPNRSGIDRRNVRIVSGARNASGVEILPLNSEENRCINGI